jgi:hypothetical protein
VIGSVSLTYLGHEVQVRADTESTISRIRPSFERFIGNGSEGSREALTVVRQGAQHVLSVEGSPVVSSTSLREVQRTLRHEVIRSFVRAHPQLLWLHAGAVASEGRAVLFLGRYGRGKSTFTTELCARGWSYLSDDVVPVDVARGNVLPFPLTPVVRQQVDGELPPDGIKTLKRVKIPLPESALHREPVPIGGIVLPEFRHGVGAVIQPFSPAMVALDLVREGLNRDIHGAAAVTLAASIVDRAPVVSLHFSDVRLAADTLEQELRRRWSSLAR